MKKVTLRRLNDEVLFESTDQKGIRVLSDGDAHIGGMDAGSYPTSLLLTSLGSCTGIDVVSILKKMKQPLEDIEIEVKGEQPDEFPKIFTKIQVHYKLTGNLKEAKVERAIELSAKKYCTISRMIEHITDISHSYEIVESKK